MSNRVYNYFVENKLLFPKKFGFQITTSIEHAILELVCYITKTFEKNEYVLGLFISHGPLLFLIYVNDLYKCSEKLNSVILFLSGINIDDLFLI